MQDGEPHLAGTARPALVRLSAATAAEIGAGDGDPVTVGGPAASATLPLAITDMPDRVVWLPLGTLDSPIGSVVEIARGGDPA